MFLFFPIAFNSLAMEFFGGDSLSNGDYSGALTSICTNMQGKLSTAIDNIVIVARAYPNKNDSVGLIGARVLTFKYQLARFIANQMEVDDSFFIDDMVKNSEGLYRFFIDKKNNNLGLEQKRSLDDFSEEDFCFLQKLSGRLLNYFRIYTSNAIVSEMTEETAEIRSIAATLYCFASDDDLENPSEFFDGILAKVSSKCRSEVFVKCMKDILNTQVSSAKSNSHKEKQKTSKNVTKKQFLRVAVVGEDISDVESLVDCTKSKNRCAEVSVKNNSVGKKAVYVINSACVEHSPGTEDVIEFSIFSESDLKERLHSKTGAEDVTIGKNCYDVVLFVFNVGKRVDDSSMNEYLSSAEDKLRRFAPNSQILFLPIKGSFDSAQVLDSESKRSALDEGQSGDQLSNVSQKFKVLKLTDDDDNKILKICAAIISCRDTQLDNNLKISG